MTDAELADFFCRGIETGLLTPEHARQWAEAVIEKEDQPASAFIDMALSRTTPALICALHELTEGVGFPSTGPGLLALLLKADIASTEDLARCIQTALRVCRHCAMSEDACCAFDALDDTLFLARHDAYGSVPDCREAFIQALRQYARAVTWPVPDPFR